MVRTFFIITGLQMTLMFDETRNVLFVSVEEHCKTQSLIFSVRSVLAGLQRDEEAIQSLADQWEVEFDFLSRASVSFQCIFADCSR